MKKNSLDEKLKEQFRDMLKNIYCMQCKTTVPIVDYEAWPEQGWMIDDRSALYQSECGDCHIAYPPAMLPAVSSNFQWATGALPGAVA